MKYFLIYANNTYGNGVLYSGSLPSGAVECTKEQYDNPSAWKIVNGAIVAS